MTEAVAKEKLPGALNFLILAGAVVFSSMFLYGASNSSSVISVIACASAFSFTANTLFSLLHEAVHGTFHPNLAANEWAGRVASAFFPTGLTLQRAFHLTHHRNNRSPAEQFDYLRQGDSPLLKYAQWYSILTGIYWLLTVVATLIFAITPPALVRRLNGVSQTAAGIQTSANEYLQALLEVNSMRARLEVAASFAVQIFLFIVLDGSLVGWLVCYACFALQWSGLQYADHAFSPLDSKDGAWDLRVNPVSRMFFLNYHYHLAHHRNPSSSWITLPSLVDHQRPRPGYARMWLRMWLGPRMLPNSELLRGS